VFYGSAKNVSIDVGAADIFQYGYNAPNANTIIAAAEPLDYPDRSGVSGQTGNNGAGDCIGHDMAFVRDYIKPSVAAGQKLMLAGLAYGGQTITTNGSLSANASGSWYTTFITRALAALAAGGAGSTFGYMSFQQGEGDFQPYGNAAQAAVVNAYRACLLYLVDKARTDLSAPILPFLMGQMSAYSIDAGGVRYATNGVNIDHIHQELKNYIERVGFYGNGGDGTGDVHYSAAEQRNLAGRMPTAYTDALANTRPSSLWPSIDLPGGDFAVSNGGKDISGGAASAWKSVHATGGRIGEDVYFEFEVAAKNNNVNMGYCGITNCFLDRSNYLGATTGNLASAGNNSTKKQAAIWPATQPHSVAGWTVVNAIAGSVFGNAAAGDRFGFLIRPSLGKAWVRKVGSAWPFSGDPDTGANPWISGISATERIFPAVSIYTGSGNTWRLHTDASDLVGTDALAISGVSAWGN
jgi:hypothetical protein